MESGWAWTWREKYGHRFDSLGLVGHDRRWPENLPENGRKTYKNILKGKFSAPAVPVVVSAGGNRARA